LFDSSKKFRITAIVPRFSKEILGGAEKHAYDILKILPDDYSIRVLTTTAKDYVTWKNEYKSEIIIDENLTIERFDSSKSRDIVKFNKLTDDLKNKFPHQTDKDEEDWLIEQGPFCPKLLTRLKEIDSSTDIFIFFSYLYFPILKGLELFSKKSIFIPMFHDEFPIKLRLYKQFYNDEINYVFNTPEELSLFKTNFSFTPSKKSIVGTYVDFENFSSNNDFNIKNFNSEKNAIAIGRMDIGKGFYDLVQLFQEWTLKNQLGWKLNIIGSNPSALIQKFESDSIHFLGSVSEKDKFTIISNSKFLINPSSMESFSIVIMEAWSHKKPILVNAKSEVLVGHCKRSNGGLWYEDYESFEATMNLLTTDANLQKHLGENGNKYVTSNFSKEVVRKKWKKILENILE
jgi:glycosyltransferase involved in cell wall biosynthesis